MVQKTGEQVGMAETRILSLALHGSGASPGALEQVLEQMALLNKC